MTKTPKTKSKPKRKPWRPTIFTSALADRICERIADGESLRAICRDAKMPGRTAVLGWLRSNQDFASQYARAREDQADHYAEQVVDIADAATIKGEKVARLRVDARKWAAGKLAPKKYGDRVTAEVSGPDGGPIETKELSELDAVRRINFLLRKAASAAPSAPPKEKP